MILYFHNKTRWHIAEESCLLRISLCFLTSHSLPFVFLISSSVLPLSQSNFLPLLRLGVKLGNKTCLENSQTHHHHPCCLCWLGIVGVVVQTSNLPKWWVGTLFGATQNGRHKQTHGEPIPHWTHKNCQVK